MKKVIWPIAGTIAPGKHEIRFQETLETEVWVMGIFIEEKVEKTDGVFTVDIPEPAAGQRGSITILDRHFEVVRIDDESFWGQGGKSVWFENMKANARAQTALLAEQFGWDLDDNGTPLPGAVVFSKSELESQGKTLMAHIMAELKIFPSVGQARKNGWDKPLELGDFSVTKKKIRFKVVD